jgi:hypothetical protein
LREHDNIRIVFVTCHSLPKLRTHQPPLVPGNVVSYKFVSVDNMWFLGMHRVHVQVQRERGSDRKIVMVTSQPVRIEGTAG